MKATELRIGNIVFSKISGGLITVQFIPLDIDMDNYGAVKLTEEMLSKFGFTNIKFKYYDDYEPLGLYLENLDTYLIFDNDKWRIQQDEDWREGANNHDLPQIQYVHQLQNLFFVLTGSEIIFE